MNSNLNDYLRRTLEARIYDLVVETPLQPAPLISAQLDNQVFIKREDMQPIFSFKLRGAYNKILQLNQKQRDAGVVAASAGNHAQGLALASRHLGIKALIVMPLTTPSIKVDSVRRLGARIVLSGANYDEALALSKRIVDRTGMTYVHAYNDIDVISGQGTVAAEILRQHPSHIDAVFVPVGGGGLCAGMAAYIKQIRPDVKMIAVESEESACLKEAILHKKPKRLASVGKFADGVAVSEIGSETFRILKEFVDDVVTVTNDEICFAIKDIFEETRSIAEPSGALALAGLRKYSAEKQLSGQTLVTVLSGANANFSTLNYVTERTSSISAIIKPEEAISATVERVILKDSSSN
ncbi:threonine ammonia-lyase, biosynthetic [Alteromonas sp. a30]|nr:threonine ammonia-lyase, biosynthetic [Alteromonas sp. a30]